MNEIIARETSNGGEDEFGQCAFIPKRSAIAEAQASGEVLWEMKRTAARDTWKEIEPSIARIAGIVMGKGEQRRAAD